ncbi:MAG: hypothetical protein KatS3mg014_1798 [Actinomycetota bacterium]|nr:MAG: hypothetical protein KatS3mg014_1798 [Actinomycetota bacterium]
MIRARWTLVAAMALALLAPTGGSPGAGGTDTALEATPTASRMRGAWAWPVIGPVIRDFDPPQDPYGAGHRGVDIAVAIGTPVRAPAAGVVSFAGKVGGELFVTLDHGQGLRSTYSWLSAVAVRQGDAVPAGGTIGLSGRGHAGATIPHLHLGVRLDGTYVDPLAYLGPAPVPEVVHLAPEVAPG